MTSQEIVIALAIFLILPLVGLVCFLRLRKQMNKENTPNAPTTELFIIFVTYGGLMLVALMTLFWLWSGMASLGVFYLVFIAPVIMGIIAYRHRKTRTVSKYHNWTYLSSLLYFTIAPVTFILLLVSEN